MVPICHDKSPHQNNILWADLSKQMGIVCLGQTTSIQALEASVNPDPGKTVIHPLLNGKRGGSRLRGMTGATALIVLIALIFGGWSYGWYAVAATVERRVDEGIATAWRQGREIACEDRRIVGFPFRVGLFCDALSVAIPAESFLARLGALRSAAQFYNPGHVLAEIDGPANIEIAGQAPYALNWDGLRFSINAGLDGLKRVSLEAKAVSLADGWATAPTPLIEVGAGEIHFRRSTDAGSAGAIDLAWSLGDVQIAVPRPARVLALSSTADVRLDGLAEELRPGFDALRHLRQNGLKGEVRSIRLAPTGGGTMEISGPFDIASDGLLTATAKIEVTELRQLLDFAARALPRERERIEQIAQMLEDATDGSAGKTRTMTLDIQRGRVSAGLLSLGEIVPLF